MQSCAATVDAYLAELPEDRRAVVAAVLALIRKHIQPGFEEGMQYGMIGYYVPYALYPPGYHCTPKQPLPYACLAAQKNYFSLYMNSLYAGDGDEGKWFQAAWKKTGKKLDMGKSCIRFKALDDLALDVIAECFRRMTWQRHVELYETVMKGQMMTKTTKKKVAKKAVKKAAAKKQ